MAGIIYLLCATTALLCAGLLWRSYRSNDVQLLFWSSVCFLGLAAENVLLYIDRIAFPDVDLSVYRHLVGLAALAALLYGLIWEFQ